ncbi:MAG: putative toxin-antitoxin system toxin component, PIN family [Deltaproteobacteria bacterium]|nr:putative toxin-antitoxin system toxin component, PIN family [Deltaproteobacteria bacterium]
MNDALEPARPRAVLDTNILLRLAVAPWSRTGRLLEQLRRRAFTLVTSEPLLEELAETSRKPRLARYVAAADFARFLKALRRRAVVVAGDFDDLDLVPGDPDDNAVIACALEGAAGYVVTDDRKHLLPLGVVRVAGYRPVHIVSAPAFLELLARPDV